MLSPPVIDLHSHILPGIDDGVRTFAEAVELAAAARADGVVAIAATPHVREDYPTRPEEMEAAVEELRGLLDAEGVPVSVLPGGEIALDRLALLGPDELQRFSLAGSGSYLLVEFPSTGWPLALESQVYRLGAVGLTTVLAHPERNDSVQERPERLDPLLELGALVQVTAASVDGRLGRRPQKASLQLVRDGRAHMIASDAHAPGVRQVGMSAAAAAVGDESLAAWLTCEVPAAVVDGAPVPIRPAPRARRMWRA